jgi:hypothetical protein
MGAIDAVYGIRDEAQALEGDIWIDRCLPGNVSLSRSLLLSLIDLGFDVETYTRQPP